ncbi:TSUP family transporter [Celerinatantimonas yamalensis]|uniref:Probable membrane transporter protein n=1 Tax=Celerinatantimonas yamalensis TaxID=559956 RepID=A0ABW9G8W0_9GAMM
MAQLGSYISDGLSVHLMVFLFLVACVAGLIDTLAGGGGLLTVPALISSGIPPLIALGTNKFQGSVGSATASFVMLRNHRVRWADVRRLMAGSLIGAMLGTLLVQQLDTRWLSFIVPLVLALIALYFLFSPRPRQMAHPRCSDRLYRRLVVPLIGAYDGFFGPGTGSFFALAGVSLRGQSLVDATAVAKTLNCASNVASLVVFLAAGHILWSAALVMLTGQLIGAWVGAHALFRINPNYLRYLVVIMSLSMLARYLWLS